MTASTLPRRLLLLAGTAAWAAVSITTLWQAEPGPRLAGWAAASLLFLALFLRNSLVSHVSPIALGSQTVTAAAMAALQCSGYEGLLLVLIAAQLATYATSRLGVVWIATQTLALAACIGVNWAPQAAFLLMPPYFGFQLLVFAAVRMVVEERRATERLQAANDRLMQLQAEVAQKVRVEERLRVANDMHDVLGHHLTALSLNLELAAHESGNAARLAIRTSQSLVRVLLSDVKSLVSNVSDDAPVDLQRELHELGSELPYPKLHVDFPPELAIFDVRASRVLLRVVQEIVTNAIRHGEARNVWIWIERAADRLRLRARDDGSGGTDFIEGFGLSGMRRRLEELGGSLDAAPAPSGGFEVRAELPDRRGEAA